MAMRTAWRPFQVVLNVVQGLPGVFGDALTHGKAEEAAENENTVADGRLLWSVVTISCTICGPERVGREVVHGQLGDEGHEVKEPSRSVRKIR